MKVLILAGGHATRLKPLTDERAKPLLPLGDRSIIEHIIGEIRGQGHHDIVVSTNAKFARDFEEQLDDDIYVHTEEQASEEEKQGAIWGIFDAIQNAPIQEDEELMVIGGDNYFGRFADGFIEFCTECGERTPVIGVHQLEDGDASQFGVVELDEDSKVVDFVEKPDEPPSDLVSTALYYLPRADMVEEYITEEDDHDDTGQFIEWLAEETPVHGWATEDDWYDIGTPQGYIEAHEGVVGGSVWTYGTCSVDDSHLDRVVLIDTDVRDAVLVDSIMDNEQITGEFLANEVRSRDTLQAAQHRVMARIAEREEGHKKEEGH